MRKSNIRRGSGMLISLAISCIILLSAFFALYITVLRPNEKTGAFNSNSESTTYINVGELLNDTTNKSYKNADETITPRTFNKANLTTLVNMISGEAGDLDTQIASLKSSTATTPLTATDLRGKAYNKTSSQSIVVKLGNLDWIVTYVSNNSSGDLVATLWLSNNHQEAWGWDGTKVGDTALTNPKNVGSYCAIINGGLYSDWSANWYTIYTSTESYISSVTYPSNMYGTSYIRAETLNNGGYYATSNTTLSTKVEKSPDNPFALFTIEDFGLTASLSTPNQMSWITNLQDPSNRGFDTEYNLNNESLATEDGNYYTDKKISTGVENYYNYTDRKFTDGTSSYTAWGNDYLWLPSMCETGNGGDSKSPSVGLWVLNDAERSTYDGSTTKSSSNLTIGSQGVSKLVYPSSWSRSASKSSASGCSNLSPGGGYAIGLVNSTKAVRPALLLNLTSAAENSMYPEFNVTVTTSDETGEYVGSDDYSYNSQYELAKSKIIVQFYDNDTNALITSHTFDKLWGDTTSRTYTDGVTHDFGKSLAIGKFYKVRIIAPTYMRYKIQYYLDDTGDNYNEFSNVDTFVVYNDGKTSLKVEVLGIADNSWLTFFGV